MLQLFYPDNSEVSMTERYQHAIDAVDAGMYIREAAERFGVTRESLRLRIRGVVPISCRRGPQLVYISDEADAGLVEAIEYRAVRGMCIGTAQFRDLVRQAALTTSLKPVPDNFPGIKWVQRWTKRHIDTISYRKGQILDAKRAECSNEDTVRFYFNNLTRAIEKLSLADEPSRIWNCDETGMTAQRSGTERVLCPKGRGANVRRSAHRENVSMMGCVNADGGRIPPMFIYAGAQRKLQWLRGAPDGAVSAVTESSNINSGLFVKWLVWFIARLPAARPQLLILDGHFAHVSIAAVKLATDHDVHLFVLPAHTSHFLQPLDVGVFQPYKALYNAAVRNFPLQGGGLPVKDDVARMACGPFETAFSSANVRRGFRDSGIFPLSLKVMLQKMVGGGTTGTERSSTILVRHHAVLEPHFNGEIVSKRVQAAMNRRRLSLDTLHVARLSLSMLIEPAVRPRPKGDFVDVNVSGGKLLTYKEMEAAVKMKVAAAEAKKQAKQEAAAARAARKVETAARKAARQQAAAAGRLKRQVAAQQKKAVASGRRCRAQLAGSALTQGPVALDQNSVVAFADV
ncbi:MFS-type transporter clz9 [Phytophthora ramorum]|uniref:MFS-type transporter clz9 n=1 Tax=Phytophthora ramorum TaxID=164328 RepID=UPI0030B60A86|nr:MFS-type transporter clz9 [Phytophthora ramorum]